MSLVKDGKLVYPLKQYRITIGEQIVHSQNTQMEEQDASAPLDYVVYDRDTRGKSWFILDLVLPGGLFIPADASGLVTADGEKFSTHSRHY